MLYLSFPGAIDHGLDRKVVLRMIESTDLGIRYRQSKILVNHAFLKPRHRNPFLRILLAPLLIIILSIVYTLPNFYGESPAVQVSVVTLPSTTLTEERGTQISASQPLSTSDASESVAS